MSLANPTVLSTVMHILYLPPDQPTQPTPRHTPTPASTRPGRGHDNVENHNICKSFPNPTHPILDTPPPPDLLPTAIPAI
ncbi:uncharacterized protein L203_105345 [Cryptococcus depauperatus CBS 7841]|uniref:Uncharacterized protein n=1 Tax=Cryptococcus depauperatus CBS 7841 TaxID=1295531 RepID=A0A1E3HLM5_9TREE|nr:hypothetical protein L203_06345 [Cryptococcus depauperatus CBS 7841]